MKELPTIIADIDMHGCEYRESQSLTHIDGFLVFYKNHGRLTLRTQLTDKEKLHGVQRLLSELNQTNIRQPQLYFWSKEEIHSTTTKDQPLPVQQEQPQDTGSSRTPTSENSTSATTFFSLKSTEKSTQSLLLLSVSRSFLHAAVSTITAQPIMRRRDLDNEHILTIEEILSTYSAALSLQTLAEGNWNIIVRITPPIAGQLQMTIGTHSFSAPLNDEGAAVLTGIAPELLQNPGGQDLELWLKSDAEIDTGQTSP